MGKISEKKIILYIVVFLTLLVSFIKFLRYSGEYDIGAAMNFVYSRDVTHSTVEFYNSYSEYLEKSNIQYSSNKSNKVFSNLTFLTHKVISVHYQSSECEDILKSRVVIIGNVANVYFDVEPVCGGCVGANYDKVFKAKKNVKTVNVYYKFSRRALCFSDVID